MELLRFCPPPPPPPAYWVMVIMHPQTLVPHFTYDCKCSGTGGVGAYCVGSGRLKSGFCNGNICQMPCWLRDIGGVGCRRSFTSIILNKSN